MNEIVPALAMMSSFLAVLLGVFLIIVPSQIRLPNVLLGLFLLTTALDISGWFMDAWWVAHPELASLRGAIAWLQMPFFTGFIWFNCFDREKLRLSDLIHGLPVIPSLIAAAWDADLIGSFDYVRLLFEAQYAAYIALAIYALWRVKTVMRQRFSGTSASWRWLAVMVAASLVAHSLFLIRTVVAPNFTSLDLSQLQLVAVILILAITLLIAFQALLKPQVFRAPDRLLVSASKAVNQSGAEKPDPLEAFMQSERPYLDPDLSLARLARRNGTAAKEISATINQRYGLHFFDFINRYRIDHAKRLLIETDQPVTEIWLASGFNTKSSFNTAFRKHTGVTPSAYRKENGKK
ncbi:AraC family transcriptional regulator [Erythrobacter insulae]|uniref:AraC family transcriptional regulator n=1 Tax=Erythrobacter insulae TaxID=2584124 RepID=A0A547PA68_9SPHN|nr:helix-turn-helix domain-containing protein [Erythrobacter insulae]TRD11042.1 AraC family transcriptional regulator [Erythrobacter insulae]